jgi:hypothetical protein
VDVLAAFPVTAVVLVTAGRVKKSAIPSTLVNEMPRFRPAPVPEMLFRTGMEQKDGAQPVCD